MLNIYRNWLWYLKLSSNWSRTGGVLLFRCLKVKVKSLSHVQLFATPWTVAHQAPLSMVFPRQEYWKGLPFLSPGDLPNPGIEPRSATLQADALTSAPPGKFRCFVVYNSFATPWTAAGPGQDSLPSLPPGVCPNSCPLSRWCFFTLLFHLHQEDL